MKNIMRTASIIFMFALLSFIAVLFAPAGEEDTVSRNFMLPSSLVAIEDEAFMGSAFQDVVIPEGTESIGARAFAGNRWLKTIKIPKSVSTIGDEAFDGADRLLVIGEGGSYAEKWAAVHRVAFMPADGTDTMRVTGSADPDAVFDTDIDAAKAEVKKRVWSRVFDRDRDPRPCEKAKMHPIDLAFP